MKVGTLAALLRARSELHSHDRWTREELLARQAQALATLRAFAIARSPFYRESHRGL
jgi:phenylacetate-CoA ligase